MSCIVSRLRSLVLFVAALAALPLANARAQTEPPPVVLTADVMEKHLIVLRIFVTRQTDLAGLKTEAASEAFLTATCTSAGYATTAQCTDALAYIGVLFSGYDPETRTFGHPVVAAQNRIAAVERDARLSAKVKANRLAQERKILSLVPWAIPPADIALMNRFRDRLLAAGR